ncbi:methyl-accepting chemotaxis protein [Paenibacillus sp. GCM10023252]|uniref:methyl-accepting chemotaxis protein n=1 Tax=Paenibacillus sp. GCM10023252 TaxID=3252649 RepID=UPI00360E246F
MDWLGWREGLPLWWSYRLNASSKADVESIFEGIAETRVQLLMDWTHDCWRTLDGLADGLQAAAGEDSRERLFTDCYSRLNDATELFQVDRDGRVVYSTYPDHIGTVHEASSVLSPGMTYARGGGASVRSCLFGPYADPLTVEIGPRTSTFHDKMTILYIRPLERSGHWEGALCTRVPNDVIGDLIQRESGHVYPDSGDNYLFMAGPVLQQHITPGTALSRSRFEDRTFTHGDNLKDGVRTKWGTVSVNEHTELELVFTDPATGQLHPGVANTIQNGSNLFVQFPGYSDYRHIPVIGKGVTFKLPHCPDTWGMMCEGDLEEVYRIRGVAQRELRPQAVWTAIGALLSGVLVYAAAAVGSPLAVALCATAVALVTGGATIAANHARSRRKIVHPLTVINRFIRINAEGKGDLTKRLDMKQFDNDEMRELAKWINNMIDSLEGIMMKVKQAAADVTSSQKVLGDSTVTTAQSTERVSTRIHEMVTSFRRQLRDIDEAKRVADEARQTLFMLEQRASEQIEVAQNEVGRIGDTMTNISLRVTDTNETIRVFTETAHEIRGVLQAIEEISAQTNLLALNASIEAARVGEHGRGFAVVAAEIRKLAERTRQSTQEVHDIVGKIAVHAEEAHVSMTQGTQAVQEGADLVAVAMETLGSAKDDALKTKIIDEVVALMEKVASVSLENRSISSEVESKVQELQTDIMDVSYTTRNVEAITAFLQQLVGQFQLTETRKR